MQPFEDMSEMKKYSGLLIFWYNIYIIPLVMDYEQVIKQILDLGASLLKTGAETHRTEEMLYRMCRQYGFTNCNFWVTPTNIQGTVTDPEGTIHTQIRHVRNLGTDFDKMADLNNLGRELYVRSDEPEIVRKKLDDIFARKPQPLAVNCIAAVLGGAFFGIFFNCDWLDAIVAGCASLIAALIGYFLNRRENNPMIFNFIISFVCEMFIVLSVHFGFGHNEGYITIGVVMLLVSGLGLTNGIRDLMHLDTVSGLIRITSALLGAIGIAVGIGLPLFLFRSWGVSEEMSLNQSILLQIIGSGAGCFGFGMWFKVKKKHLAFTTLGAIITWLAYVLAFRIYPSSFAATITAAFFCAAYAQIIARVIKAPASIFMSVAIFSVVPGASLYYTMYYLVTANMPMAGEKALDVIVTCFAIVVGFMIVEVVVKCLKRIGAAVKNSR